MENYARQAGASIPTTAITNQGVMIVSAYFFLLPFLNSIIDIIIDTIEKMQLTAIIMSSK